MTKQKERKEQLNVEEALTKSEAFIIKNKKSILATVAVLVLLTAGVLIYNNFYAKPRQHKAQIALIKGQQYFEQGNYEYVLNGDSIGFNGLEAEVINKYGNTKAGNLAHAYIGISNAKLGNFEAAVKSLEKFNAKDVMVAPAILAATGNCYAELGKLDKASDLLMQAANKADNNTLSPIFLLQAGELLIKQDKADAALKAYTQIKEKYSNSYQAMDIEKYIERAKSLKK